ncbi:MAG: hypothetical protein H0T78_04150 [Longispora sp.]|nr:hypothetical protein [Longispora sp. (in: high G+C Gram-positive bacteria)]
MSTEARLANLERDVDRHEHDVKTLFREAAEVKAEAGRGVAAAQQALRIIPQLSNTRRAPQTSGEEEEAPADALVWLTIDDLGLAAETLLELEAWLGAVYVHYPNGELKDCWRRHPAVVEELLVLRDAHESAWSGKAGSSTLRLDWHSRHRPDVATRVEKTLDDCGIRHHVRTNPADFTKPALTGTDDVTAVATWWAHTHGQTPDPTPTPAMLAEARARKDAERQAHHQQY